MKFDETSFSEGHVSADKQVSKQGVPNFDPSTLGEHDEAGDKKSADTKFNLKHPCYNAESKFGVLSGVTFKQIFSRRVKSKGVERLGSNFAVLSGYRIGIYKVDNAGKLLRDDNGELILDSELYMTKEEGLGLANKFGLNNAYVEYRKRKTRDKKKTVVGEHTVYYLAPYRRQYSFWSDDRARTAYKLDNDGKIKYPLECLIKEDECSSMFWLLYQRDYADKQAHYKAKSKGNRAGYDQLMQDIKADLSQFSSPL